MESPGLPVVLFQQDPFYLGGSHHEHLVAIHGDLAQETPTGLHPICLRNVGRRASISSAHGKSRSTCCAIPTRPVLSWRFPPSDNLRPLATCRNSWRSGPRDTDRAAPHLPEKCRAPSKHIHSGPFSHNHIEPRHMESPGLPVVLFQQDPFYLGGSHPRTT
jgi:hypothetical protein